MSSSSRWPGVAAALACGAVGALVAIGVAGDTSRLCMSGEREAGAAAVAENGDGAAPGDKPSAERLTRLEERVEALEDELRRRAALPAGAVDVDAGAEALAALRERVARLEELLDERAEAVASFPAARALTDAIARGDDAECMRLLSAGADPDGRDDARETPLAAAARAGRVETIDLLLAAGADLERKASRGMTPLLAALDAEQEEAALALLDRGARPLAFDKNGEGALFWASFNGCERVARRLLDAGLDPDVASHDGGTPLLGAIRKRRHGAVRLLLEAGADPNLADRAGTTPLARARDLGDAELVELLRAFGAL